MNRNKNYTDEELLKDLKKVYNTYGYISKKTISLGKYNSTLYYRRFGTLENTMKLLGVDVEENEKIKNNESNKNIRQKFLDKYPKELLIGYIQEYTNKYGYPTEREFNKHKEYPSRHIYEKVFGSFGQAIRESNIEIPQDRQWYYDRKEYSKEELLKALKEQTEIKLKDNLYLLTTDEVDLIRNMPSLSSYYAKYKSLKEAYLDLDINYDEFNLNRKKEDMKKKYIEMRNILKRPPNSRDMDKFCSKTNGYYSSHTYCFYFNSIHDFQLLMGDKPSTNWTKDLSDEENLELLRKLAIDLGGITPTQRDVELCDYTASVKFYPKRFGSYDEAIRKAGMTPRNKREQLVTPKGNKAYSGYEYKFMLLLEQYNIEFKKEEHYKKYIKDFDKKYRFDFTLEFDNELFFIEIFGITGNEKYDNKVKEKIQLCIDNKLNLIEFYPNDISYNSFDEIYKLLVDNVNKLKQLRKDLI